MPVTFDHFAVHTDWTARGYSVPDVWSKAPRDADPDAPAVWSFQEIPAELLPGASCFALTYHKRPKGQARHITIPPNTLYAIDGVVFVTAEPEARAVCWRNLLAPDEPVVSCVDRFEVPVGPHRAAWMTPDAYRSTFGFEWVPATHPYGELAVLQLLASEPATAIDTLEQANRHVYPINGEGDDAFLIAPDVRDGFLFSVRQYPVERWMQERSARTGEKLILA